jgi:hypothetical protein
MGAVSGDQNMITGTKIALTIALKSKASRTREKLMQQRSVECGCLHRSVPSFAF